MTAATFSGDSADDVIMAYQNSTGTFSYHVWTGATTYAGNWYTSGAFSLSRVANRLVAGQW